MLRALTSTTRVFVSTTWDMDRFGDKKMSLRADVLYCLFFFASEHFHFRGRNSLGDSVMKSCTTSKIVIPQGAVSGFPTVLNDFQPRVRAVHNTGTPVQNVIRCVFMFEITLSLDEHAFS